MFRDERRSRKARERLEDDLLNLDRKAKRRWAKFGVDRRSPKSRGAAMRRPFQFGQKRNMESPVTPLRYVTGFNII
jgi:hypothetical protein